MINLGKNDNFVNEWHQLILIHCLRFLDRNDLTINQHSLVHCSLPSSAYYSIGIEIISGLIQLTNGENLCFLYTPFFG
nr:hypothetical protein Iba_chr15dCG2090 [Ipomoea batatas]